jgi:hypothetical protein
LDEFLAWRKDRFWKKPVVGLFHVVVFDATNDRERRLLVATKQIYASHYLESGIELVELRQGVSEAEAELTFVSRMRADIRPSGFNWIERLLLRRLVRGRLRDQLGDARGRLAAGHPESPRPRPGTAETRTRAAEGTREGTPARP